MFDSVDDAALVAEIEGAGRAEASAAAHKLALIAELVRRREDAAVEDQQHWVCDPWAAAACEVAAALHVGQRAASKQMRIAVQLWDRLPSVAALFAEGAVSASVVATLTWRTHLIEDEQTLAIVDAQLASHVAEFGAMTATQLERTVDKVVDSVDPAAVRRTRTAARGRDVRFGHPDDETGTTTVFARLTNADAVALKNRVTVISDEVCSDDPRTPGQRRSDALGVIGHNGERLACRCGDAKCPAAGVDWRAASTTIYVIAEPEAAVGAVDKFLDGDEESNPLPLFEPDPKLEPAVPARPAALRPGRGGAVVVGGGVLPAPMVAQLIADGAKVTNLTRPEGDPSDAYRPPAVVERFVRMRDMTCRFPGCDRPAEFCDVDHTTPWPAGATHPSNIKCLCRIHHLLKTFWRGWSDQQLADGAVVWTSPSGRTYTTFPASRTLFPLWDTATAALPPPATSSPPSADKSGKMPRRRRTRAAEQARHIAAERALNEAELADRERPSPSG
ncbi:HNH endonuclease signature motif containing protein [Mycobacterium sp. 852002-51961_SCH5331710]|uniref:HNH endonuclease signature motif containing protein n=1 Tax=Mycobacterium sp. 852002-51961_SCH5331710 TaxID=1834105 RepID=UPI0007FF824A|nr:HNH endonuclease signature motif containing protein [Mycobacterium sp. 852002-51961_SCH5331710]OBB42733.1 HNH endonuclease [Mycobacterium sp. 852002-51961_SCH5331710]